MVKLNSLPSRPRHPRSDSQETLVLSRDNALPRLLPPNPPSTEQPQCDQSFDGLSFDGLPLTSLPLTRHQWNCPQFNGEQLNGYPFSGPHYTGQQLIGRPYPLGGQSLREHIPNDQARTWQPLNQNSPWFYYNGTTAKFIQCDDAMLGAVEGRVQPPPIGPSQNRVYKWYTYGGSSKAFVPTVDEVVSTPPLGRYILPLPDRSRDRYRPRFLELGGGIGEVEQFSVKQEETYHEAFYQLANSRPGFYIINGASVIKMEDEEY